MAIRLDNAINVRVPEGETSYSFPSAQLAGYDEVQLVLERANFERNNPRADTLVTLRISSGGEQIGGVSFGEQVIDGANVPRPGQRMLWSTAGWRIPDNLGPTVDITVNAAFSFNCTLHIDLFP